MKPGNLIQNIHDFFLNQYNGNLDGNNNFLAFEPLGLMVSRDDFRFDGSFNADVAQQQVSIMADTVPSLSAVFEPDAFNKISDQYRQLVGDGDKFIGTLEFCGDNIDPSQTDQYFAYFGFLKKIAQQKFSQTGEQASILDPMVQVAACNITPSTWYDPTSPIWRQKTFRLATPLSTTHSNSNISAPVLNWKVGLNLQKTPVTGTVYNTINTHLKLLNVAPVTAQPVATQTTSLLLNKSNYSALRAAIPFSQMVDVNRVIGLDNNAVTQPVNSSQLSINFSYSVIQIERDWLYQPIIDKAAIW